MSAGVKQSGTHAARGGRLRGLDGLRGIAAFSVMIYHFGHVPDVPSARPGAGLIGFADGHLGVQLFFIISGFVILRTLERCRSATGFAVSRVSRLYPAYIVCACLTGALIVLSGDTRTA